MAKILQLNSAGINFIQNHPPPGHDLKGAKTVPPGQSLCTKTLPSGQNRESKAPPRYINLENFTNVSINSDTIWNEKLYGLNK